jgi:hypothetical protein
MLWDVDLIKVSRKRKVVMLVFEMKCWRRFPVSELSVVMENIFKQRKKLNLIVKISK